MTNKERGSADAYRIPDGAIYIQEHPVSNDLIMVSVYSQHVAIPHRGCVYGHMIRAHITVPRCSDSSLIGILEKRISAWFTDYCTESENGLGMYAVMKDLKVEQEHQHIYYDFYLMAAPMFKLIGLVVSDRIGCKDA